MSLSSMRFSLAKAFEDSRYMLQKLCAHVGFGKMTLFLRICAFLLLGVAVASRLGAFGIQ